MKFETTLGPVKSDFAIWDSWKQCPAWKRKPKNTLAKRLSLRTIQEADLGIRYWIPPEFIK